MECRRPADQCPDPACSTHHPYAPPPSTLADHGFAPTDPSTSQPTSNRWLFAPGANSTPPSGAPKPAPAPQYPPLARPADPDPYYPRDEPALTQHGFHTNTPADNHVTWLGKPKKDRRRRSSPLRITGMLIVLAIALLSFESRFGNPLDGPPTVPSAMAADAFTAAIAAATPLVQCQDGDYTSSGTGFAIEPTLGNPVVLTAAHVVAECDNPQVTLTVNGTTATGTVTSADTERDVAVITTDYPLPTLRIAAPPTAREPVVVIGHPKASIDPVVTYGKVTEVTSQEIFLRADVLPGNSGSPVIDSQRRAVAVVTADLAKAIVPTGAATRIDTLCGSLISCQ